MQSQFFGPQTGEWDLAQLGGPDPTVVQRWASPILGVAPFRGTIDPDSGVFSFDIGSNFCGDKPDRRDGGGRRDHDVRHRVAPRSNKARMCSGGRVPSPASARVRFLPGAATEMLDDAGEQCDDFNQTSGDCCSSSCQLEPAGAPCSDGKLCTDDACDGAGTSGQHVDNSAPCGTICAPADLRRRAVRIRRSSSRRNVVRHPERMHHGRLL